MEPFADHLGISSTEFSSIRGLFSSESSKVLLVEGPIDQEYFCYLQSIDVRAEKLNSDVEIVAYGGKDTLKNTTLLQFVLRKFDRVFVTYDLDADGEVRPALQRAGLKHDSDSVALGLAQPGKDCIEGLLPQQVLARVNGRETDLIMALGSINSAERRRAKETLKRRYLEEFQSGSIVAASDLKEFSKVIKKIQQLLC